MSKSLYETDFYAWTQQQAEAIRAGLASRDRRDRDYLAEEIESLGASQKSACESAIQRILQHLLKIEYVPWPQDLRGWRKEVRAFRGNLESDLSPSLRARLSEDENLDRLYRRALSELRQDLIDDEVAGVTLPDVRPYTWAQISESEPHWYPEPRYATQ